MGGIIKNVLITLILILIVPTGFRILYEAQSAILSENIIPKLLLGTDSDAGTATQDEIYISPYCKTVKTEDADEMKTLALDRGNYISLLVFRNFYQLSGNQEEEDYFTNTFFPAYCGYGNEELTVSYFLQSEIYNGPDEKYDDTSFFEELLKFVTFVKLFEALGELGSSIFGLGVSTYYVNYEYFVSTIVGIAVCLILISTAFDVAVRSVKLTFLQLISPIPIISYIDPKSGKDGMFKRWYTEVFKTWASLFIRLLALFFGVYLIQQLDQLYSIGEHEYLSSNFWIQLFMLIGILMFCKQLPKLLEELIPGMKGAGSFNLNPFKKVSEGALGGKLLTGAAIGAGAMGAAAVGSAGANAIHSRMNGKNWKDAFKSAGRGLGTGAFYGAKNGFAAGRNGKYNFMKEAGAAVTQSSKHRNYEDMLAAQGEIKGPFKAFRNQINDKFTDVIGQQSAMGGTSIIKGKIGELNEQLDQEQGRESQYNTAFGNMTASRPERTPGYVEAAKYNVSKDENGNFVGSMEYGSYEEYMSKVTGDSAGIKAIKDAAQKDVDSLTFESNAERESYRKQYIEDELERKYADNSKFISANEFSEVQKLASAIADSSATQKQIKSQIKKIESNQLNEKK